MKKLTVPLTSIFLLAGTLLTIWGLAHMQWPNALPWTGPALRRYAAFMIVCAALVIGSSYWSKRTPLLAGGAVAVGLALLGGALWPLLVTLWFAFASTLLGRAILAVLRKRNGEEDWLISFLVGAGVYGTAVGLLAHFPVNYPGVYGIALALPIILSWRVVAEKTRAALALLKQQSLAGFRVNRLEVAIAVVALVHFVVALMPEVGYDALASHLFIPAHLASRHQWGFDASTYVWAVMPMLGDWIFSIGNLLAGEAAARLINVGFIFILGWLVRDLVQWAGGTAVGARWAVLIFLSTPLTFAEGSSLFIESVWASFVAAGTLAILKTCSNSGDSRNELPVAGLLLGCALAAKAVTFTILPVLLLLMIWRFKSWSKTTTLSSLMLGLCIFIVIGLIPYITAWRLTGNPVFPFLNHVFHSIYYPSTKDPFAAAVFNQGLKWDVLYQVTFQPEKYLEASPGVAGFQWLLLFLPASIYLVITGHRRTIGLILVGVLSIALTFHATSYLRYVFPAWVMLTAVVGVALDSAFFENAKIKYLAYVVAVCAVGLNLMFLTAGAFYRDFDLKSVLSGESRHAYLEKRIPIRKAVELANVLNTSRTAVAVFANPLTAGLTGDALYPSWYNWGFQREIAALQTEQELANILLKRGVSFIILDSNWNGANCCVGGAEKEAFIEKISEKIAEFGSVSVRRINAIYQYKSELISNPDFTSIKGWSLGPEAKYDSDTRTIRANVGSPAIQGVAVAPGGRYLNTVVSRCLGETTLGRVQINWLDAQGAFVRTDIRTFDCSPAWREQTMEVIAPPNVATAIVYTTSHTPIPLEFKSNSLRQ
jgi:4-amino-4-deoxy-L-arabinose transferase-like glycosyltransferase